MEGSPCHVITPTIYEGQGDLFVELYDFYLGYERNPNSMALVRSRIEKVRERLKVLRHFAQEGKKLNELASIRTSYEFSKILSEINSIEQESTSETPPASETVSIRKPVIISPLELEARL
ncbi:MAG: hypothetical protein ACI9S8_003193 [Chlamydiales bacterium]|jgi:hypothetical protein